MTRAGIYARISRDSVGEGLGVARQVKDCEAKAAQRGWDVAEVFVDNDVSASRGKPRPAYQRLMQAIESGEVDAVVVWDLDRLHRSPMELEQFLVLAEKHRLALASVGGDIDLSTEQGVMFAGMKAQVGRYEVKQLSRRVKRKQQELRDAGKAFGGGIRAFGFKPDRMTVIPEEADEIRAMVDKVLSGWSLSAIVRDLNRRDVPTVSQTMAEARRADGRASKDGSAWSATSVRSLLQKPRLAGLLTYRGAILGPGAWDPIIDRERFDMLQVALEQRRPERAASNARQYLLSGIAQCGTCGAGMQIGHHGGGYLKYRCRAAPDGRHHAHRSLVALDEHVIASFFQLLSAMQASAVLPEAPDQSAEIERLRGRLRSVAIQQANDEITPEQLTLITKTLRERIAALEATRVGLAEETILERMLGSTPADQRATWDALDLSQRRFVITARLGYLAVHPTRVRNRGLDTSTIDLLWSLGTGTSRTTYSPPA